MILALSLATFEAPVWVPAQLRDAVQFELLQVSSPNQSAAAFERISDGVSVRLTCGQPSTGGMASELKLISSKAHFLDRTRDGYPIAGGIISDWTEKSAYVKVVGSTEKVSVGLAGKYQREGQRRWLQSHPFDREMAWAEDIARATFAAWCSWRLVERPEFAQVRGKSIKAFKTQSGREFVDLTDLCRKFDINMNVNDSATRCAVSFQGRQFVIPLGSDRVKIDSDWTDLPDVVMSKNSRFIVPVEAFR